MNDNSCFPEIDIKNIPRPVLRRSHARCYTDEEMRNCGSYFKDNLLISIIDNATNNFVTYCDNSSQTNNHTLHPLLPIMKPEDYINDFINNKIPSPRKINEKQTQTEASTLTTPHLNRQQTR